MLRRMYLANVGVSAMAAVAIWAWMPTLPRIANFVVEGVFSYAQGSITDLVSMIFR